MRRLLKTFYSIGFLPLFCLLLIAISTVSYAKEPEPGLHVNSYYGSMEDGAVWPEEFEEKVAQVLAGVDPDWSDEQKIVYLHDYLVTNCDYDFEALDSHDATKLEGLYGVMVKKKGICSGYTGAFVEIAGRMGIRSVSIGSSSMNHSWVLVEIGSDWYFLDCTWDDPAYADGNPNFKMICDHRFFLKSQEAFSHGATDWRHEWKDKPWDNAYDIYQTTTYDNACWNDSLSPLVIYGDGFLVLKKNGDIYKCDSKGNNALLLAKVENASSFGTMVGKGQFVFVCNSDTIFSLDATAGTLTPIYTLSSSEKASGSIYGIEIEGTTLRYDLAQGPAKSHYQKSEYLNLEELVGKEIKGTSLNTTAVTFYEAGTSYELKLLDCSGKTLTADSWSSSDPSVATVDSQGLVTGVGYGKSVITAIKNGNKYYCTAAFDTLWQNEYLYGIWGEKYHISDHIFLDRFVGEPVENTLIPAFAYVGGERFQTAPRGYSYSGPVNGGSQGLIYIFPENEVIRSISLEPGVTLDYFGGRSFSTCTNLNSFDFGGIDLTGCANIDILFYRCSNLESVDLSGCRIGHDRETIQLLNLTDGIRHIICPEVIREGLGIPLRTPLHVKNSDGTFQPESISNLADAPRGAELSVLEDTTWQEEYETRLGIVSGRSGNHLYLDCYNGAGGDVFIPAKAVVKGKEYPVCLRGAQGSGSSLSTASLFRNSKDTLKSLAVEEGVIVDTNYAWYLFLDNTALTEVNWEGADFSKSTNLYGMFFGCSNLETVSFKGCDLGALTTATAMFSGCRNLKKIITPDVIAEGTTITLPVIMYEQNADGTTKETEYMKLEDAPRGCILVSEKKLTPDPEPHVHSLEYFPGNAATCTAAGNSQYWYCEGCGKYYSDSAAEAEIEAGSWVIPALGHLWDEGVVTKEATEEEEGILTFTCERCSATYTRSIPKKDHEHVLTHTEAKDATCTEAGNTEYWHCEKCGRYFSDEEALQEIVEGSWVIPAPGHRWNSGEVTKEATEEEEGIITFSCENCSATYTKTIPKKDHEHALTCTEAKDATCTEEGNSQYWYCEGCGSYFSDEEALQEIVEGSWVIPALGHLWDEGVVTKEPTQEEEGIKTFTCQRCRETYTESIPKVIPPKPGVTEIFDDVKEGSWYVNAVQYVYDNNIMGGKGASFQPNARISREEFVRVLFNHAGTPATSIENPYADVKAGAWYEKAVLWAKEKDIANGKIKDGKSVFGVGANITREEMALMFYKYAKLNGYTLTKDDHAIDGFSDANLVSTWAKDAMNWAVTNGVMSGKAGNLDPRGNATRAECASMFKNMIEKTAQ